MVQLRLYQGKEIKHRIREKYGYSSIPRPEGDIIWLHGASVGETQALLPLMRLIKEHYPTKTILLTSGTKSSAELLEKHAKDLFIHQFMPLDNPLWCERFLKFWQPSLACMTESDFWPIIIDKVKKHKIPLLLINGRMSPKSALNWQKAKEAARFIFNKFDHLFVQNKQDKEFFSILGGRKITQTGTIKYSTPALQYDEEHITHLQNQIKDRPFWLFASSHNGEEEICLETHISLKKEYPYLLTILVPRHPTRSDEIVEKIKAQNLKTSRLSKNEEILRDTDIYLADAFGVLGDLYKFSSITCIGGSFIKLGCHNPIEAAQLNCAILFGPHIYNFSETCADLLERNAAIQCKNATILQKELKKLLNSHEKIATLQKNAYHFSKEKADILPKLFDHLKPYIEQE